MIEVAIYNLQHQVCTKVSLIDWRQCMTRIQNAVMKLSNTGLTYSAISGVLGVSRYTVARWADGETEPVAAVPILFALKAMAHMDVPVWPRMAGDPPLPRLL